jgi:hypothetical protein
MDDLAFVVAALLEARTLADLQRLARSQGLQGLSRLRKAELIDRLLSAAVPG